MNTMLRDVELRRLHRFKQVMRPAPVTLGPDLVAFFKASVQRRQEKLGKIGDFWEKLVPRLLNAHCALESFSRGSLTVLVDSSSHLYELKQLLLAGLEKQLLLACRATGLRKVSLKLGRWYDGGASSEPRPRFD